MEANLTSKIKQLDEKNDQLLKDLGNYKNQNIEQKASISALQNDIEAWKTKQTSWKEQSTEAENKIKEMVEQIQSGNKLKEETEAKHQSSTEEMQQSLSLLTLNLE